MAACAAAVLLAFSADASAQPNNNQRLQQVERDRAAANVQAQRLRAQIVRANSDIAALDRRLIEAGRHRAEAEAAATDAEARLTVLRQRAEADGARYQQDRSSFESALIAAALAQRRFEPNLIQIGMLAAAAAPLFARRIHYTSEALEDIRRRDAEIAEEQRNLVAAQAAIDAERADVIGLLAQRRALQTTLIQDASAAETRARRLASEARSLRELAQRVQTRPRVAAPSAPTVIPAAWLAPAEGRVARGFGAQTAGGPPSQGVALRTRANAQVIAPASATVAYAGPFRGYGHVLILNRDDGYAIVLAGLGTVRARVGETVIAGQPIGEMSNSDTQAPELYVEVRRNGQPVDPARWLAGRGLATGRAAENAG